MGLIQVTSATLKSKAEELGMLNESFKTAVSDLESVEGTLSSQWEGEANEAFHNAFTNDKKQMDAFYDAIKIYKEKLLEVAQNYEKAEQMNTETASSRTY